MNNKVISLDKDQILEYQQNKDPYLFIDKVTELLPGKYANGFKKLKEDEWFFKVHWKGNPNMPGMLQIESLVQLCALTILGYEKNKGKFVYLSSVNNVKFYKKIVPGDLLKMETELLNYSRGVGNCVGKGFVNEKLACKAEFKIVFPEDMTYLHKS